MSGIYIMQSGAPFGIVSGDGNSGSQQGGDRADFTPGYSAASAFELRRGKADLTN